MKVHYRIVSLLVLLSLAATLAVTTVLPHADAARVTVFHVAPKSLRFYITQGIDAPAQTVTLKNSGKDLIIWLDWNTGLATNVKVEPESGIIKPGQSVKVRLYASEPGLGLGIYPTQDILLKSFDSKTGKPTPGSAPGLLSVSIIMVAAKGSGH
jgi:hypothetical protein